MIATREDRIEMALSLYKQGKSARFCDCQCGLKKGTTKQEAEARGLYNQFRQHSGGQRLIHPGRQCAICLYSVGFGCKVIGRIIDAPHNLVSRWVKKAGVIDPQRSKNADRRRKHRTLFAPPVKDQNKWAVSKGLACWIKSRPKQKLTEDERRARVAEYGRRRLRSDHGLKLKSLCRNRIYCALKKQKMVKSERTFNLIGCSVDYLREYLASMFEAGMSWDNYGEWHIDHIIPCASFDLTDQKQQKLCFHFSNLRPAWARENIVKSDKMPDNPQLGLLLNA